MSKEQVQFEFIQLPRGAGKTAFKCNQLKTKLEREVKGYITVHVIEDTLVVTIQPTNEIIFRYTQNHISSFTIINIERLAQHILEKHYLTYLAKIFFKQ